MNEELVLQIKNHIKKYYADDISEGINEDKWICQLIDEDFSRNIIIVVDDNQIRLNCPPLGGSFTTFEDFVSGLRDRLIVRNNIELHDIIIKSLPYFILCDYSKHYEEFKKVNKTLIDFNKNFNNNLRQWCSDNCKSNFYFDEDVVYFEDPNDAMLFKLKWC